MFFSGMFGEPYFRWLRLGGLEFRPQGVTFNVQGFKARVLTHCHGKGPTARAPAVDEIFQELTGLHCIIPRSGNCFYPEQEGMRTVGYRYTQVPCCSLNM